MRSPDMTMPRPPAAPRRPDAAFRARTTTHARPQSPDTTPISTPDVPPNNQPVPDMIPNQTSPDAQTSAPSTPEATRTREVSPETQSAEINQVAQTALHQKTNQIEANGGPQDDNERALWGARTIAEDYRPAEGQSSVNFKTAANEFHGIEAPGNELNVIVGDNTYTVLFFESATADTITCRVKRGTGSSAGEGSEILPRQAVVEGQLRSERGKIKELFTGEQQTVVDMYVRASGGEDVLSGTEPRVVNEQLAKAASASGMLTAEDGIVLINAALRPLTAEDGASPQDIHQREQARSGLLDRLKGQNVLDADTLIETVKATGVSQATIAKGAARNVTEIQRLQQLLIEDRNNKDLQKKLHAEEDVAKVWKKLQEADIDGEKSPIRQFFDRVQQGNMKPEDLQVAVTAIKEGRLGEFVGNAILGMVGEKAKTETQLREREERKQAAFAALRNGGEGSMWLFMILEWAIGDVTGVQQH